MSLQLQSAPPPFSWRLDGLDGQEDELEDIEEGKLDPPTDDEGRGSILERNRRDRTLETEDEDGDASGTSVTDERPHGERAGSSGFAR